MRSILHTAIALAIVSLAYFSVDDELRPVITTRKQITDERIEAARTAIDATEATPCNWREMFKENKP